MSKIRTKIESLSNQQLIELSMEMRNVTVPDDALIRKVIQDTEMDTTAPVIAFVAIAGLLHQVLADRLKVTMGTLDLLTR